MYKIGCRINLISETTKPVITLAKLQARLEVIMIGKTETKYLSQQLMQRLTKVKLNRKIQDINSNLYALLKGGPLFSNIKVSSKLERDTLSQINIDLLFLLNNSEPINLSIEADMKKEWDRFLQLYQNLERILIMVKLLQATEKNKLPASINPEIIRGKIGDAIGRSTDEGAKPPY